MVKNTFQVKTSKQQSSLQLWINSARAHPWKFVLLLLQLFVLLLLQLEKHYRFDNS